MIRVLLLLLFVPLLVRSTKRDTKTPSREQARRSEIGRLRRVVKRKYGDVMPLYDLASQEFRATIIRPDMKPKNLRADGLIESLEWRSEGGDPVLQGSLVLQRLPSGQKQPIHEGHVLRLEVKWGKRWRELWRMRLYNGQQALATGTTYDLADELKILQDSIDYWHFTKTKKGGKPKGWKCHDVVKAVAKRYKIKLGKVAAGKHYITDISGDMSPLAVIQKAYAIERRGSGKRFVMRWNNGKLDILPMRRNPFLYVLNEAIRDGAIAKAERSEKFATAVTVRATIKKHGSKKRRKISYQYVNKKAVKREGFVHKVLPGDGVKDIQDAKKKAKRYIADNSVRQRTLTGVQHQGIAFVRRGDAMMVSIPDYGFTGIHALCWVSSGTWALAGGDFTMTLDFSFDDPAKKDPKKKRKDKDKKTRDDKRKAREKK